MPFDVLLNRFKNPGFLHESIGKAMPQKMFQEAVQDDLYYREMLSIVERAKEDKHISNQTRDWVTKSVESSAVDKALDSKVISPTALLNLHTLPSKSMFSKFTNMLAYRANINVDKILNGEKNFVSLHPIHASEWVYEKGKIVDLKPKAPKPEIKIKDETHLLSPSPEVEEAFSNAKAEANKAEASRSSFKSYDA
jgi:hypothetical protein